MRKYIHIAKGMQPQLTREAADCIAEEYSKLRSQDATANNIAKVCTTVNLYRKTIQGGLGQLPPGLSPKRQYSPYDNDPLDNHLRIITNSRLPLG